jgi:hypothetical protein
LEPLPHQRCVVVDRYTGARVSEKDRPCQEFLGKVDTTTPYVIGKIVSRLEMDSRWALARSVRALIAERDALKGKLDARETDAPNREVR